MSRAIFTKATMVAVLAIGAVSATTSTANAQVLNFTGSADLANNPGSNGSQLLIDFLTGAPPTVGNTPTGTIMVVPTTTFTGVANGSTGVIQDLVIGAGGIAGTSAAPTTFPVSPFVTIGGYSFSITSGSAGNTFGPISLFDIGVGTVATFGVNGVVTGGTFGTAGQAYKGVFTAQFSGQTPSQVFDQINSGNGIRAVSFSAEFTTLATVPEPSTYALLGTGIAALGLTLRRRRSTTHV